MAMPPDRLRVHHRAVRGRQTVQRDFERDDQRRRLHRDEEYWGQGRSEGNRGNESGRRDDRGSRQDPTFDPQEYGERAGESYGPQGRSGYAEQRGRGGYGGERGRFEQGRGRGGYDHDDDRRAFEAGEPQTPYDQGEIGSWYGGDSGMGEYGASQAGPGAHEPFSYDQSRYGGQRGQGRYGRDPYEREQFDRGQQDRGRHQRGQFEGGEHGGRFRIERSSRHGESYDADQSMQGPFVGRGPRGYRRSDERILEDVCDLLTRHGQIDASQMEVDVRNGEVFLRGMADSGQTRRLVEEIVEDVTGVHDVRNELRVNQRTGYAETSRSESGSSQRGYDRYTDDRPGAGEQGHEPSPRRQPTSQQASQTRYERTSRGGALDTDAPAYGTGVSNTSGAVPTGAHTQHAEAGGDHIGSRFTVRESMEVVGSDGERAGQVKEVRGTDFLLDRPMRGDVYVPFSGIRTVDGDRVMLDVPANVIDDQGWPTPDLTGTSQQRPSGGG